MVGELHLEIEKKVKAPVSFVFEWWTDLRSEDSELVDPLKSRRIVRREGDMILAEDSVKILGRSMKYDVKVTLTPPDMWVAEYSGRVADAVSKYKLTDTPEGTEIHYSSEIKPKGILTRLASPIVAGLVRRVFDEEMDEYIHALEADWRRESATHR